MIKREWFVDCIIVVAVMLIAGISGYFAFSARVRYYNSPHDSTHIAHIYNANGQEIRQMPVFEFDRTSNGVRLFTNQGIINIVNMNAVIEPIKPKVEQ